MLNDNPSPSQYELQFRKWGLTKNLKSSEWAALISQYDRLCQSKSDVRITVSGVVLSKNKIDRARRRYLPPHKKAQGILCKGESVDCVYHKQSGRADVDLDGALSASQKAHVEFTDEAGGEWKKYSGAPVEDSTASILHKSSHAVGPTPVLHDNLEDRDRLEAPETNSDLCLLHDEEALDPLALSSDQAYPGYRPFSPSVNFDDFFINPVFSLNDGPFPSLQSGSSNLNGLSELSTTLLETSMHSGALKDTTPVRDHQELVLGRAAHTTKSHLEGARNLITALVQHSKTVQCHKTGTSIERGPLDVEVIMESLQSLLPDTETPLQDSCSLTLRMRSDCLSSTLFKTLVYSFTNNFAGLRDVPRKSIMQMIRQHQDIRTQLFEVIKSGQPGVAKSLADSFFRAAVEGSDADAVVTIIHHTEHNPMIAIDPNDVLCKFEGENYTPIELAAAFRNTELVRTLVASHADPNKTYKPNNFRRWEQGALALALGYWDNGSERSFRPSAPDDPEPVDLDLLRLLLDCGAEVRIDLAQNAMRPGPGHTAVAEELMSRIPASEHQICFQSRWLLMSAIHYLENSAANRIIRRVFVHCSESKDCGKCALEHPRLVEKLLYHAARRANLDLTKFLVQYTTLLQSALAAAIRATSDELVQFLMNKGARVDGPVESWYRCKHSDDCCVDLYDECGYDRPMRPSEYDEEQYYVITPITTPLAEAIRSRNDYLMDTFERLGACTRLTDKYHFHAAVLAAAEVGNTSYLRMVLDHASRVNEGFHLTLALAVAIRNDETDSALILLDAGVNLVRENFNRMHGDPLVVALERRNKRVVDSMLECIVQADLYPEYMEKTPLESAAAWCDVELIKDMLRLGSDIDFGWKTTPLGAAVKSRNENLVSRLLDLGADPKAIPRALDGLTPLRAAMEIGDYEMVRFLISKGASPADTQAFIYAMGHDPAGYEFLVSEFKSQFPHGLRAFGGELLARAIELGSQPLMDSLLKAGADVNSWCTARGTSTVTCTDGITRTHRHRVLGLAIRYCKSRDHELIRELLDRGAKTSLVVYEYEQPSASGRFWIKPRETPLLLAIQSKSLQLVNLLLERGAELHEPARRGLKRTPLQAACETGSYTMVEFLLKKGARVNDAAAERHGGTALQLAAKSGSLKIVRLLLDNGADPYMPKSKVEGQTAFEAAAESGCIDVLCLLWDAVLPLGFSEKECQSAKDLAKKHGHRGCVDFIDFLSGGSSQSFLVE